MTDPTPMSDPSSDRKPRKKDRAAPVADPSAMNPGGTSPKKPKTAATMASRAAVTGQPPAAEQADTQQQAVAAAATPAAQGAARPSTTEVERTQQARENSPPDLVLLPFSVSPLPPFARVGMPPLAVHLDTVAAVQTARTVFPLHLTGPPQAVRDAQAQSAANVRKLSELSAKVAQTKALADKQHAVAQRLLATAAEVPGMKEQPFVQEELAKADQLAAAHMAAVDEHQALNQAQTVLQCQLPALQSAADKARAAAARPMQPVPAPVPAPALAPAPPAPSAAGPSGTAQLQQLEARHKADQLAALPGMFDKLGALSHTCEMLSFNLGEQEDSIRELKAGQQEMQAQLARVLALLEGNAPPPGGQVRALLPPQHAQPCSPLFAGTFLSNAVPTQQAHQPFAALGIDMPPSMLGLSPQPKPHPLRVHLPPLPAIQAPMMPAPRAAAPADPRLPAPAAEPRSWADVVDAAPPAEVGFAHSPAPRGGGGVKVPKPAPFSGGDRENVEDYMFSFLTYLEGNCVPRESWPHHAGSLLTHKAKSAWTARAMQAHRMQQPLTWDMFVECMFTNFARRDRALHARRALHQIKQNGTVSAYIQHFQMLVAYCGEPPLESDQVLYFWEGLHPTVRMHCKQDPSTGRFFTSIHALMNHALLHENTLRATLPVRVQAAAAPKRQHEASPSLRSLQCCGIAHALRACQWTDGWARRLRYR